ncbi:Inner membrane transport protein YbaT [Planctomycetes bacterium Poly30]|uniref:Inner membrane transport protein YbaT n=1 Tax=Saltatorellus ferox TaxID=2528018 RepID=A0A518ELD0_9BACT|nr:Inner membrane transport protein YbaT [Planctomycetes bacterium Poly30]
MSVPVEPQRSIGLFGATAIGVGAIVGGGILALAGSALAVTGPSALLAFTANGVIAIITALSFAELSTAFPQSGGTYTFAKRVLAVGPAFAVGWVVWFASIIAAVLYALGTATFVANGLAGGLEAFGVAAPEWLAGRGMLLLTALVATLASALVLVRSTGGGGSAVSVAKVAVFAVLILGGAWVGLRTMPPAVERMTPFFPGGASGFFQAMGYTFIALQGFDLVAAVAGEVKDPRKTLPRAMLLSLGVALIVYVPLLVVVIVLGVAPGETIQALASANPDTVVALAAQRYLGLPGFWLVVAAGLLSMFSALLANVYAASRIAQAMARDRTLPASLERVDPARGTPAIAVLVTAGIAAVFMLVVGDVAAAGAASSLIFLCTFALVQVLCVVARHRRPKHTGFRVPLWPWLPLFGAALCGGLAIFQSLAVPRAGLVALVWLLLGGIAYGLRFGPRARVQDALAEAVDADLLELRGRSPLVLVPTSHPSNAGALSLMGACIAPPRVGRVLMLNVVKPFSARAPEEMARSLDQSAGVLRDSLGAALRAGARAEALATVGLEPLEEIERVARLYRCATLLLGMSELSDAKLRGQLESLVSRLTCNVALLRIPTGWRPEGIRRVLVPVHGTGAHSALRARLLASLFHRAAPEMEVTYLLVLPADTTPAIRERRERSYEYLMREEAVAPSVIRTRLSDDVGTALAEASLECDFLILGLSRLDRNRRAFSEMTRKLIATTSGAVLLISEGS